MEHYELVKELEVDVTGLSYPVKGKILKMITRDKDKIYIGKLSHYCKPSKMAATIYIPSLTGNDISTVEYLLLTYLKSFTLIDVTRNEHY